MFGIILISIVTLIHVYVFLRVSTIPLVKRYVPKKVLAGTGFVFWVVFFAGRKFGHGGTGVFAAALEFLGMNWMGIVFLVFICLFAADVVTGFGFIIKKSAPLLRGLALCAGIIISAIALFQGLRLPVVRNYDVNMRGLPASLNGTTIVVVSDTHLGSLIGTKWLKSLIARIRELNPDIIALLGDIHEGHGRPADEFTGILKELSAPLGVWAVKGNHESHRRSDRSESFYKDSGFKVLENRWEEVLPGLVLAGVEDLTSHSRRNYDNDPVSEALTGRPYYTSPAAAGVASEDRPEGAVILLSHSPLQAEKASGLGAGLMLSGHTHGGQIWPFSYFVKQRYPMFAGRYEVGGMSLIVSRGTGTWGPRMRFWHPGEILCIKLYKESEEE